MNSTMIAADLHVWVTLGFVALAMVLFAIERFPTEGTALLLLCGLLLFFQVLPLSDAQGHNLLNAERLLQGFGNPALLAVLALLVIGEGLVQTNALNAVARLAGRISDHHAWFAVGSILVFVACLSGFVNNTPLVIIFIPILQAVTGRLHLPASNAMIPLSYATILGGMTTLIGSSTNLLVSSSLTALNRPPLGLFEVTPVGVAVAAAGMLYILALARRLLPVREPLIDTLTGDGKEFIAQLTVRSASRLVGTCPVGGVLAGLPDMVVKLVQRGERAYTRPFEEIVIESGDTLVVAATRQSLAEALARDPDLLPTDKSDAASAPSARGGGQVLAEVMVVPRSPVIGRSLEQLDFRHRTHCLVIGLYRRAQVMHQRMTRMRLAAGDVLLIQGAEHDVRALRQRHEVVVLEGTASDLRRPRHSRRAVLIFAAVIGLAASGKLPIIVAAILGATAMIITGTLTLRQAARALDRRIILLVGSALALGEAMEATGAGAYLAQTLLGVLHGASPAFILSAFFAVIMTITNVLSNNACAVLFTPIAVSVADSLGLDPHVFAIAVLIASDGCFATPIGYQTNLLVMGPGNYTFADYLRFGLPLSVLVWLVFSLFAPWWFGL